MPTIKTPNKLKPGDRFFVAFDDGIGRNVRAVVTVKRIEKAKLHFSKGPAWRVFLEDDAPFWAKNPMLVYGDQKVVLQE